MKTNIYIVHKETNIEYHNQIVSIKNKDIEYSIPVGSIKSVHILADNSLNVNFLRACLKYNIPMYFISNMGKYLGKINNIHNKAIRNRLLQYEINCNNEKRIKISKDIIRGKINNSLQMLYRLRRLMNYNLSEEIDQIVRNKESINRAQTIEEINGYEGYIARSYFQGYGKCLPKPFNFRSRTKHPPLDPANSLLSFGYTLLANNIMTAIETNNMDPYIGFIHSSNKNSPALVFDLMEEFRSITIDHIVVNLIESKKIDYYDNFKINKNGSVYIDNKAKKLLIKNYEKRLKTKINYDNKNIEIEKIFNRQAEKLKKAIKENKPYEPFSFR